MNKASGYVNSPFMKIIIPAVAGVVGARLCGVPAWITIVGFGLVFICAIVTRGNGKKMSNIYIWSSVLFFFFSAATLSAPESVIPQGNRIEIVGQIVENPYQRGRWNVTTADVGYYRAENGGEWIRTSERIQLSVDTCYTISTGQQLAFRGWVNPIDTTGNSYGNLMRLRGEHSRVYLTPGNLIRIAPHISRTPVYYAAYLQNSAIERLSRLDLEAGQKSVVTAMTAGDKRSVGKDIRDSYSSTGAAHLLAVSGLHVGIVFLLVNLLLYLLPAVKRGHIYKNIIAIVIIWLYAMMAGLSPSVVRAALMFSFAQAALASGSYRNGLNIMLGSAVVMLALNPNYWGDPSFMLSYAAVLSITAFFQPLFSLVRSRYAVVNALSSVIIVGVVASLGTAPLVAYWFGNLPIAGMLINPLVIVTAHVIVMFGVLWVIMPFGSLNPLFSWILGLATTIQNNVVEWSASLALASIPVQNLPLWMVILIYAAYIAIAVWIYNRPLVKRFSLSLQ